MRILTFFSLLILPGLCWAKLNVFACEPEWADLTAQLATDKAEVFTATHANQDPHHIEARPSLIAKMRKADLVVCTGAELEVGWLPLLIRRSGNKKVQSNQPGYFEAAMEVERLEIPTTLDRSQGDVHSAGNPHVHLDPNRVLVIASALTKRLIAIDPANQSHYESQLSEFNTQWKNQLQHWEQKAQALQGMKVVTHHKDWIYLNHWLGLEQLATIEPKPGIPPSAKDQKRLLENLGTNKPDVIMLSGYQNPKAAQWLADKLQVPMVQLPYTVGGDTFSTSLGQLFDRTIDLLIQAKQEAP